MYSIFLNFFSRSAASKVDVAVPVHQHPAVADQLRSSSPHRRSHPDPGLPEGLRRAGPQEGVGSVPPVRGCKASTGIPGTTFRSSDWPRPCHQVAVSGGSSDRQQRRADHRTEPAVAASERAGRLLDEEAEVAEIERVVGAARRRLGGLRSGRSELFHLQPRAEVLEEPEEADHRDRSEKARRGQDHRRVPEVNLEQASLGLGERHQKLRSGQRAAIAVRRIVFWPRRQQQ